jgi:cytochrome P450
MTETFEAQALDAYAEPIRKHAREWADGVASSVDCDVINRVSRTFTLGAADVTAEGEWKSARSSVEMDAYKARHAIPEGAMPWVERVWRSAFRTAWAAECATRREAAVAAGTEVLRAHVSSIGDEIDRGVVRRQRRETQYLGGKRG